jgi:hypothetical protein
MNQGFPTVDFRNGTVTLTPGPSIVISPNTALLTKGDVVHFSASGGHVPYAWSSTSPSVATVDTLGNLTGQNAGFAKVVAVDSNGYVDTSGIVEVRAFKLSLRDTSCYQGQTIDVPIYCTNLTGLGILSGQFQVTYDQNRWTPLAVVETGGLLAPYGASSFSANNGILSISFAGSSPLSGSGILLYIRLKASGQNYGGTTGGFQNATFNENLTANVKTATLTVQALAVVSVTPTGAKTFVVGDSLQYSASGGVPPYTWSVAGTGSATISSTGLFKPSGSGKDTVKVKDSLGGAGASGQISVYDFRINIPDTSLAPISSAEVPIYVTSNVTGVQSYDLLMTYTTNTFVQADSVDLAGTLSNGMLTAQSFHGDTIAISAAGVNKFFDAGTLLKVRFAIPNSTPRPTTININLVSVRFNEGVPLALPKNGSFQILNGPLFSVNPGSASLHAVVGQKDSAVLTVHNSGTAGLTSTISVIGPTAFTVSPTNINVASGDSAKVKVYFQPASTGPANATIHFVTNDANHNPVDVSVSGITPYPILVFNPLNINFGTVRVGQHKDTTVTISNTGTDTLKITNITGSLAVFTAHPTNSNIPPGQSFVDTIRFAPSAGGSISGRFSVASNSLTNPDTLGVSGFGNTLFPILVLSNSSFNFGIVSVGTFKDTVVTISNNGTDTLKISGVTTSTGVFTGRPTVRTVPPGQSFKDTLRFVPASTGGYSGRIFIAGNAPSSPDTITVSGTGHAPFPILILSRSVVNFGTVKVGQHKDTTITITNSGTDTLRISSSTASLSVFSARPAVRKVFPGQSVLDTLRFAPVATGGFSGRIVVVSDALSSPDTISVSGTGNPATDVYDPATPDAYSLEQNYPNPFNPSTIIRYGLRSRSTVRLAIYNIVGQKVDELVNGEQNEGFHEQTWNPSVPSGAYFYKIEVTSIDDPANHFTQIRKMILMK